MSYLGDRIQQSTLSGFWSHIRKYGPGRSPNFQTSHIGCTNLNVNGSNSVSMQPCPESKSICFLSPHSLPHCEVALEMKSTSLGLEVISVF